jgi:hypothetical protein
MDNDLGPHRGVNYLASYIRGEQNAGHLNAAVDPEVVALMLINAAFSRAARRRMLRPDEQDDRMPSVQRQLATIAQLLERGPQTPQA